MDDKIQNKNLIPGCEKLTRPEEINVLSKYLKKVAEVTDSQLKVGGDPTVIPGDPRHPGIDLSNVRIGMDGAKELVDLEKEKLRLSDPRNITKLSRESESLEVNKDPKLSKGKEELGVSEIDKLGSSVEILEGGKDQTLTVGSQSLEVSDSPDVLGQIMEELKGVVQLEDIPGGMEILRGELEAVLNNSSESLGVGKDITSLGETKETLVPGRSIDKLGDVSESLSVGKDKSLSETLESLSVSKDLENLKNPLEALRDTREDKLDPQREDIRDKDLKELGRGKEDLSGAPEPESLNDTKDKLSGVTDLSSLKKDSESLVGQKDQDLDKTKEDLSASPEIKNLEKEKESLSGVSEIQDLNRKSDLLEGVGDLKGLNQIQENLVGPQDLEVLGNGKEEITGSEISELKSIKEELSGGDELDSLREASEELSGTSDVELKAPKEELSGTTEVKELLKPTISLSAPDVPTVLPKESQELSGGSDIQELPGSSELLGGQNDLDSLRSQTFELTSTSDLDSLREASENLEDRRSDQVLPETSEDLSGITEVDSLGDFIDSLDPQDELTGLGDYLGTLEGVTEIQELPSTSGELSGITETDSLDNSKDTLSGTSERDSLEETVQSLSDVREDIKLSDKIIEGEEHQAGELDKYEVLEGAQDITELTYPWEQEKGYLPGSQNKNARYKKLSVILGSEAEQDSSDGLGTTKTPAQDGYDMVTRGEGDIMFASSPEVPVNDPTGYPSHSWMNPANSILGTKKEETLIEDKDLQLVTHKEETLIGDNELTLSQILKEVESDPDRRTEYAKLQEYLGLDNPAEVAEYNMTIDQLKSRGNWGKKVAAYLGAILSKNTKFRSYMPEEDVELYKSVLSSGIQYEGYGEVSKVYGPGEKKTIDVQTGEISSLPDESLSVPAYKLPEFSILGGGLNPQSYLRWAVENTIGKINVKGATRQLLIKTTLWVLAKLRDWEERKLGGSRSLLPGDEGLLGALGGVLAGKDPLKIATQVIGSTMSDDYIDPVNRPKGDGSNPKNKAGETEWKARVGTDPEIWKGQGSAGKFNFKRNYLGGKGVNLTLEDLAGTSATDTKVGTVEGLREIFQKSSFITTANTVTGSVYGGKVMTLDSNHIWEMKFYPYCGPENGNKSWLPSVAEINTLNALNHGYKTAWGDWIPFTSFELQSKKLTSKTLGLYDGEISYPVSMEFTNELRLTIADDAYKSWKTYFERCAEAGVYLSKVHDAEFYKKAELTAEELTPIVRGKVHPGQYKNLTFRCVIYVMSPQFSTIRKFDFLVVLKDFTEDYQGEIDSSGTDLSLNFSIVGENPAGDVVMPAKPSKVALERRTDQERRTDYASVLSRGVTEVVKLL